MKKVFYTGYISSIIEYACIVWGIGNKTYSNRIIKLQKRATRIVLKKPFKTSSKLMFSELKWLSFPTICIYYTNVMIFKSLNNQTPNYVNESMKDLISVIILQQHWFPLEIIKRI